MSERPTADRPKAKSLSTQERATLRWIFWVVGGCIAAVGALLFGVGLLLPNHWNVTREIVVHAPLSTIHPVVDDWHAWVTWAKDPGDDPTLTYTYAGSEHGVGAVRRFSGRYAGTGQSEIVRSDPQAGIAFVSAVRSPTNNAHGSISYRPQGGSTSVTWNDQGTIESFFGVFLRANVEDELSKYMDRSLNRLKALAETRAQQAKLPLGAEPTPQATLPVAGSPSP
jgi:hypothetical protein